MFEKNSLYAITDENLLKDNLIKAVEKALSSGIDILQYRAKKKNTKDMYEEAIQLKSLCKKYKVPLIINDRIDIALAVDADGVHIGQEDIPVEAARRLIGFNKILGLSTKNLSQVKKANKLPVDYIGFGSIFPTKTKENIEIAGIENLKEAINISLNPVVAIGGININNIEEVINTGCKNIAVVSAIFKG
ncbi:MAG: thiamine phosphate synthase, partial [Aquificota bacterium]